VFRCAAPKHTHLVIALKTGFKPFALSLSKGCSWFDKPVLSGAEGLTTNGVLNWVIPKTAFSSFVVIIENAHDRSIPFWIPASAGMTV
jgi:hypothetical protein